MEINIKKRYCWPDSRTVLAWIKSDPRTFKTFVAHRLAEIEEFSKTSGWSYVPTKQTTFGSNHWWFNGPEFLKLDCNKWPKDHNHKKFAKVTRLRRLTAVIEDDIMQLETRLSTANYIAIFYKKPRLPEKPQSQHHNERDST
ncbi:uncharacterized protein LOC120635141 [Pararge aegeria]|uniref:uncharacterized protein LOC120635141 n=1 Tax=Pararge aegeria TaxID=116150 RepID=UPI0019D14913|nr:uncharacterized protein LOC120635141 [Pararge aegeria]